MGGNVTLYFQGHLMDPESEYYKKEGHKYESKTLWNEPYYENYSKFNSSYFLKFFSSKTFSTVCPSCPQWHTLMCEKTKYVFSFKPNGVLFDQIGGRPPYLCFDESHPHSKGKPSLSYTNGRIELLNKIQNQTKILDKSFGFLTENITDVYSQYLDCLHGLGNYPSWEGNRYDSKTKDAPSVISYPEMFRYCFPNTKITIRNQNPFIMPRAENYALIFGFIPEMEIRYSSDCQYLLSNKNPQWKVYAAKVANLRKKYWDLLGKGIFVDDKYLSINNANVIAKSFEKGDSLAVVLWNDNSKAQSFELKVKGYSLFKASTIDKDLMILPKSLEGQEVVVAIYKKI